MSSERRRELIRAIEELRGSRVLTYVTGDRGNLQTNIGDDAVRPILEHLRSIGSTERLDVFIYSRGGAIDVPWRLNSAFRRTATSWDALVPFRANSAATLLSLGANRIVLGRQAELGPIDPTLEIRTQGQVQQTVSVEDVMAFPRFVQERFDLDGDESKIAALNRLVDRVDALTLGSMYRTHSHIRYLADKMLRSRGETMDETTITNIVGTLAEKVYAHGHAVGFEEATEVGLHVEQAAEDLDQLMWDLLRSYEEDLHLLEPLDPIARTQAVDEVSESAAAAVIESADMTHEFGGTLQIRAQRQMPESLQVQLNLPFQLPPGMQVEQIPEQLQQAMQQMPQMMLPAAQTAVNDALKARAPIVGCEIRWLDARWRQTHPIVTSA